MSAEGNRYSWFLCPIETKKIDDEDVIVIFKDNKIEKITVEETVKYLIKRLMTGTDDRCIYKIKEKTERERKSVELYLEICWFIKLRATAFSRYCSLENDNQQLLRHAPYYPILMRMYYMVPISGVYDRDRGMEAVMLYNFITIIANWCNKLEGFMDQSEIEKYIMDPLDTCFNTYELFHVLISFAMKSKNKEISSVFKYYKRYHITQIVGSFCLMKAVETIDVSILSRIKYNLDPRHKKSALLRTRHNEIVACIDHFGVKIHELTDTKEEVKIQDIVTFHQHYYCDRHTPIGMLDFVSALYSLVLDSSFDNDKLAFDTLLSLRPSSIKSSIIKRKCVLYKGNEKMRFVSQRISSFESYFKTIKDSWDHSQPRFPSVSYESLFDYDNEEHAEKFIEQLKLDANTVYTPIAECTEDVEEFIFYLDDSIYSDRSTLFPALLLNQDKISEEEEKDGISNGMNSNFIRAESDCFRCSFSPDTNPLVGGNILVFDKKISVRDARYFHSSFGLLIKK